jgi:alkanesulfonate monooxygenase SsuD/methylene tetrahydromethanopterin reductase-like flavin-dependent oxidoreductase (luciferase family)
VRNPIPICIGGEGEQITLKLAAQYAALWNGFGPFNNFKRKNAVLDRWCAELGRDPNTIERSILTSTHVPRGLDRLVEAGANHIIVSLGDPWKFEAVKQLVRWRDARR